MNVLDIARVCHEANRALCNSAGDFSQPAGAGLPDSESEWMIQSSIDNVNGRLENPDQPKSHAHETWMQSKLDAGWVYGPIKCAEAKTHPDLVPYDDLSDFTKSKDHLFAGIVDSLSVFL